MNITGILDDGDPVTVSITPTLGDDWTYKQKTGFEDGFEIYCVSDTPSR